MTFKAFVAQARHLRALRGELCVRAKTGAYAWALLLDFGTLAPPDHRGYRQPQKGLVVECPWRIETRSAVIVASADAHVTDAAGRRVQMEGLIEGKIQICVGKRIARVSVYRPSFMACVQFTDDLKLWIFPEDSADYEIVSEDPRCSWYVAGSAVPSGWEE